MAGIRKIKDTSLKMILNEPELFVEFLRDFVPIEILKNISPADIEDVSERLLPVQMEQKDLDTVKRINLKGDVPLFVITVVDHESTVNFRAPFKMLLYITLLLEQHEKDIIRAIEEQKKEQGEDYKSTIQAIQTKDFKYPPVLPIVFYDGKGEWTAEKNFLNRTAMNKVFHKYIPKFEYELVDLSKYSIDALTEFGDVLSMLMIIDKVKSADEFTKLGNLPKNYLERLDSMEIPPHLKKLIINIGIMLLRKINVPQDEIDVLLEKIDERGISQMLAIENYDVQETRRVARAEARAEADQNIEMERQRAEMEQQRANKAERQLKFAVKFFLSQGYTAPEIAMQMEMSEQDITNLVPELA